MTDFIDPDEARIRPLEKVLVARTRKQKAIDGTTGSCLWIGVGHGTRVVGKRFYAHLLNSDGEGLEIEGRDIADAVRRLLLHYKKHGMGHSNE